MSMHEPMDRAIWVIAYDVESDRKSEYLDWFHSVHIPEKLARAGYRWAAHYALEGGKGYAAFFGADTTQTFLDPSPSQLAQRQSAQTRRFIGMRCDASACILAEQARVDGPEAHRRAAAGTPGPVVQFGNYNAASALVEDDLGAWYAQERFPLLSRLPGCIGARKMLAAVGAYKHAILHEFVSLEARETHFGPHEAQAHDPTTWMGRVRPQLTHAPRSPAIGRRIWPPAPDAPPRIYKVLRAQEWNELQARGVYAGSRDDVRDGFIHFSTREQLAGTLERHFAGETGLVVLEVDAALLGDALKWEPSRAGALFPHLYASLPASAVRRRLDSMSALEE